jgi:hypothetical protein
MLSLIAPAHPNAGSTAFERTLVGQKEFIKKSFSIHCNLGAQKQDD